jgi:hypothetical protein
LNGVVSKTTISERVSGVQIPLPPPETKKPPVYTDGFLKNLIPPFDF